LPRPIRDYPFITLITPALLKSKTVKRLITIQFTASLQWEKVLIYLMKHRVRRLKKKKNKMGVKWCRGEKMRIPTKVAGRVGVLRVEFNLFNLYFYIVLMCYY